LRDDSGRWFLVNASPDLPAQIQDFPDLQPRPDSLRNSPLTDVLLTNSDLDHVLGLFSLREGGRLNIHATAAVRDTLAGCLGLETVLNTFCGSNWHEPPLADFQRLSPDPAPAPSLLYRAIELPGHPPPFAKSATHAGIQSVAYQFLDPQTGGRLLVAPDVAAVNQGLLEALATSDAVLFDGTFWSADELGGVKPNAPKAAEMGHVTIRDCSLELLGKLAARTKIYIHINNTNPVLAPHSPERATVEAAGITVGEDGFEFEL
jgi:pyrroloquinoline quinone biosynthesis protein B